MGNGPGGRSAAAPLPSRPGETSQPGSCRQPTPAQQSFIYLILPIIPAVPTLRSQRDFNSFSPRKGCPETEFVWKPWLGDTRARADGPWKSSVGMEKHRGVQGLIHLHAPGVSPEVKGRGAVRTRAGIQLESWVLSWEQKIYLYCWRWDIKYIS